MMKDVYELSPSMRVLILLHNISAVDYSSAKRVEDIDGLSGMSEQELQNALDELASYGYVLRRDGLYYLSGLGISIIRSIYT